MDIDNKVEKNTPKILACRILPAVLLILITCLLFGCGTKQGKKFKDIQDFNQPDVKIALSQGSAPELQSHDVFPKSQFQLFVADLDCYAALEGKKVDAVAFDRDIMEQAALKLKGVVVIPQNYGSYKLAAGINKNDTDLLKKVNAQIQQLEANGTLKDMKQRWLVKNEKQLPAGVIKEDKSLPVLNIGTSGIVPPWSFMANNQLSGYDIELSWRIANALGMRPEFQIMNYDSLIAALETKKVDIVLACLNETPERAKKISFSTPYNISYSTLMVRKDDWEGPTAEGTSSAGTNVSKGFMAELQESFQRNFVMEDRYKIVLSGLKTTIVITVWSAILGTIMGFGVCLLRRAKIKVISRLLDLFVSIMAGMPLVVFLMIMYYIVFGKVTIDPVYVAILAFAISMAASTSDMMSAGIDAVDKGQLEAAYAMGFSKMQTFIKIVTPQALKHIMPTFTGEFVSMFKMTSIVGYIAIQDLTKMSDIIRSRTYEAFFPLIVTALIYFVAAWSMAGILVYAQYKLDPKKRQRTLKGIKL